MAQLRLEGFLQFEPRMVMFEVNVRINVPKVWTVSRLCVLYPVISHATEEQSTEKPSVRLVEKCQLGTIQCADMAAFYGWPRQVVDCDLPALGEPSNARSA